MIRRFPPAVWILLVAVLVNRIGLVVVPMLALYLREHGFDAERALAAGSVYAIGAFVSAVPAGLLADRYGRRRLLVVVMGATAIAMTVLSTLERPAAMIAGVFAVGLFAEAHRPVVSAMLTDLVAVESRVPVFALQRTMVNVGSAIGPMIGGLLAHAHQFGWLFVLDGGTAGIFALIAALFLPETRPASTRARPSIATAFLDRRFVTFCVALLPVSSAFFAVLSALPIDLRDSFGPPSGALFEASRNVPLPAFLIRGLALDGDRLSALLASPPAVFGGLLFVNGALVVCFEYLLSLRTRLFATHWVLFAGAVLTGAALVVLGRFRDLDGALAAMVVLTAGEMLFAPSALHHVSRVAPEASRASYLAAFGIVHATALVSAPWIASQLLPTRGPVIYWCSLGAATVLAAPLFLLGGRCVAHPLSPATDPANPAAGEIAVASGPTPDR